MVSGKTAWIFANGELPDDNAIRAQIDAQDAIYAADGGLRHITRLGLKPQRIIGDLDSADPQQVARFEQQGILVERHPAHKNETDLELALLAAAEAGYLRLRVVGALGGRLDMTLANIFLLSLPALRGLDARLEDGQQSVFLIYPGPGAQIEGRVGQGLSLLPLGGLVHGIHTTGLEYPLRGETLLPERSRGISNRIIASPALVTLEQGCLICIIRILDEEKEKTA